MFTPLTERPDAGRSEHTGVRWRTILLMATVHMMVDGYGNIYAPLLPLGLLLLTGLYLFVLPYVAKWRGGRHAD